MTKLFLYYIYTQSPDSSDELLHRAASAYTGEKCSAFAVRRAQGKKPFFTSHPQLHFSVSHSGGLWACVFAESEVGLDVQFRRPGIRYERLAGRWFHANEAAAVLTERDFYDIWSRKEAFVKALGIGIDEKFKMFDVTSGTASLDGESYEIRDIILPGDLSSAYSAAIAYGTDFSLSFCDLADFQNIQ